MLGQEIGSMSNTFLYLLAGSGFLDSNHFAIDSQSYFLHSCFDFWIEFAAMNQRSRLNLLVIQIFIASLMFALFGRLFYLQVAAGPKYRDAALSIQSRDVVTPANRGFIVDSSGVPMALNKVGLAVTVDRTKIDKLPDKGVAVVQDLVNLLGLNFDDVWQRTRLCGELPKGTESGMLDRFTFPTDSNYKDCRSTT